MIFLRTYEAMLLGNTISQNLSHMKDAEKDDLNLSNIRDDLKQNENTENKDILSSSQYFPSMSHDYIE